MIAAANLGFHHGWPSQQQRDTILTQLCAGDDELRLEVEAMLDQSSGGGSILSRPIWGKLNVPPSLIGQQLSHYKITEKIGSGGMDI